jgi:hypothetical protein
MPNMMDYLEWRGDISFSVDHFNEVDNLILSELAYVPFEGIVSDSGEKVRIKDASDRFFEMHDESSLTAANAPAVAKAPLLMRKAANTKRFQGLRIYNYVNEVDESSKLQFAAMTFILPDHSLYVAFRGTDHTIVGWEEDFNMSFLNRTPGQMCAIKYINMISKHSLRRMRVGGHSKGGNFAVYGSAFADSLAREKIMEVYSNDGPGFRPEVIESVEYKAILPKVVSIVPEHTIVSQIMESAYKKKIVKSSETGLMQHDAMSWQVMGNRFVEASSLGEDSKIFDHTLRKWISGFDDETRSQFVSILFEGLTYDGSNTTEDLKEKTRLQRLNTMRKRVSELPVEKQKLFGAVLIKLATSYASVMMDEWKKRSHEQAKNR